MDQFATFTSELFLQHVSLYAAAELQSQFRFFILRDLGLDNCIDNPDEKAFSDQTRTSHPFFLPMQGPEDSG